MPVPFYTKKELNNAIEYLKTNSQGQYFIDTYKESMKAQPYFTATKEQKEDNDWTPDFTVDLYNQGVGPIFLPTRVGTVIGNGVKEVSPIIIGKTGQLYDDVTLKAISKAYNISPYLTSKYILDTENSLKIIGGIEIANDTFNDSSPIPSTFLGRIFSGLKNIEGMIKDEK